MRIQILSPGGGGGGTVFIYTYCILLKKKKISLKLGQILVSKNLNFCADIILVNFTM